MKPLQIVGNLPWPKVVVLPEVEDLAHDLGRRRPRGAVWRSGPVRQSCITVLKIALSPFVKRLTGNAEVPAGPRDVAGALCAAAAAASGLIAVARNSSSRLHSKVFRLRRESGMSPLSRDFTHSNSAP